VDQTGWKFVDMLCLDVIPHLLPGRLAQPATSNSAKEVVVNTSLFSLIDHLIHKLVELGQLLPGADLSAIQPALDRCKLLWRQHLHAIRHVVFAWDCQAFEWKASLKM
jgi:hypothetical protein